MDKKIVMAADLPEAKGVIDQAPNVCRARCVSFEDLLKLFDDDLHGKLRGMALGEGVTHVVCFENLDMWSSNLGARKGMIVGSKQSFTIEKVLGTSHFRLGDVPSRFMYPVAYASVETLRKALPPQEEGGKAAGPSESRPT